MHRLFGAAILTGMLVCATAASAQSSFARAYLDVNFGVAQTTKSNLDSLAQTILFQETATFSTVYTQGNGTLFDIGGGVMFNKKFGVGVTYAMTSHDDEALMTADVPHPQFFNANGTGSGTTPLKGKESQIHISAVFVAMDSGKMKIRLMAGPSFVNVKQDIVEDFFYTQTVSGITNTITVTASDAIIKTPSTNLVGFHVGGDFAYFFTKVFGVGGDVRYVFAASKDIADPFQAQPTTVMITIKGGGVQVAGGIRLRF